MHQDRIADGHWVGEWVCTSVYTLKCRGTRLHSNAKALSWLALPVAPVDRNAPTEVILLLDYIAESPVSVQQICAGAGKDHYMETVLQYFSRDWPASSSIGEELFL